jgi:hypothetical protein
MTTETNYERLVTDLERTYEAVIARQASRIVDDLRGAHLDDGDALRDEARELLTTYLLHDEAWGPVEAIDISDIAYEAVERAIRG